MHVELGSVAEAKRLIELAPPAKANDPAVLAAKAAIDLAEQAASVGDLAQYEARLAANPADHQARFDLAVALAAGGRREDAIEHLIEIVKRDRTWNEDGARRQLLQFFEAWGPMDEMTILGRRRLSSLLFS
jgi:putative thioredoxin